MAHDPFGEGGRLYGRAAHDQLSDTVSVFKLLFRVVTLPVWLPRLLWSKYRRGREMDEFALKMAERRADEREIALAWVEGHSIEYPFGEYDPGFAKLQRRFRRVLEARRQSRSYRP